MGSHAQIADTSWQPDAYVCSEGRMEDETSSSEPLLAPLEAQDAAANGNDFCMDGERIAEARVLLSP